MKLSLWKKRGDGDADEEHAVLIYAVNPTDPVELLNALEDQLETAAEKAGGEYDGNEVGGGRIVFYSYGPDADRLWDEIRPTLPSLPEGSYVIKRYGDAADPEAREERLEL